MSSDGSRYDRIAIALHWLVAPLLIGQIAFGLLLDDLAPRGTPARASVINLHKSTGIVLGVLIVARFAWRLMHRPPPWDGRVPRWQQGAARIGHRLLYACMLTMPLSGYVGSNFSARGVRFFGHSWPAWGPDLPRVYGFFNGLHVVAGWLLCFLIAGHLLIAAKHALVDHDGVFRRIWPAGRT